MDPNKESSDTNLKLIFYIVMIMIFGSTLAIIMPIIVDYYDSSYFILLVSGFEFCIIFGLFLKHVSSHGFEKPKELTTVILCGVFGALMAMFMIYSASPKRTPVVIQSVFTSTGILFSVIFTKYILKKKVTYIKKYIYPSVFLLLSSVFISLIPFYKDATVSQFLWILMYLAGVVFRSIFNILQEKYFTDTRDPSFKNKIHVIFYTRLFQFITCLALFWMDYYVGHGDKPFDDFINSLVTFITDPLKNLFLQAYVVAFIILYIFSIYLNEISTNYNMVATVGTNPSVAIFFTLFPQLNSGKQFSLAVTIPSLVCGVVSIILWIKGEQKYKYIPINGNDEAQPLNIVTENNN